MSLDLSDVATELLGELASNADGTIQLLRETGGSVDDITGDYTPGTTETIPLVGAITYLSGKKKGKGRSAGGVAKITVDNQVQPLPTDKAIVDGVTYKSLLNIKAVSPAGIVQVYTFEVAK